ncbi:hypothetical protein AB0N65_17240 [Paenarthrobacter sp. NPDC089322]|uniref:hypothetical protein n=1 Tax=Paenarthrobacter sp. NPDC089322 TaxID=3155065 RepID=UPI0034370B7A
MIATMVLVLAVAAWLHLKPSRGVRGRAKRSLQAIPRFGVTGASGGEGRAWARLRPPSRQTRPLSLVVLVQQLAALLRGGRGASRLWEELWVVHGSRSFMEEPRSVFSQDRSSAVSRESLRILGAARAASAVGNSPAQSIRDTAAKVYPRKGNTERRIWMELAACLDVAENSGCPLAGLLTRFAAQLEAEEDAEAARQTALAGPKATVRLLSWLPVFGLALGIALGVDPLGILLDNIMGVTTLVVGLVLTVAGRVWSSRLVASAVGGT